jgi:unsaturated chondroitin disaccharide hydrolase
VKINYGLTATDLVPAIDRLVELSAGKIRSIETTCPPDRGSPVFTVDGRYTARGWTEWTRGFQYGSAILQYDARPSDDEFLHIGRTRTLATMPSHLTHTGVHDHGFTIVSTYGNLWRLAREGRAGDDAAYGTALRVSGAVQAMRWRSTEDGGGYLYSFNGPHSLFVDTLRSCRALALAHLLGHELLAEHDEHVSLLGRLVGHARSTARYNVFYGQGRDAYDVPGRTVHEAIFNTNDGRFRCPSTQQGYSPFTTWTRGLAWAMLGFAELLEFLTELPDAGDDIIAVVRKAAEATCQFYVDNTPTDGIPYWDTGAPGLVHLGDYLDRPAEPFNPHEPVDSSAAAIAAQGLLRLGHRLGQDTFWQAGLTVVQALFDEPYLSTDPEHQGLLLHSVYHRPNGWDQIHDGQSVPNGESSMWGDYHAREVAVYLQRIATSGEYHRFFGPAVTA